MSYDIFAGENLLISSPIFTLTTGQTWAGVYDDTVYTSGLLTIGKRYKITTYNATDDFVNVGGTNTTGNVFVATGTTPTDWTNGSSLQTRYVVDDVVLGSDELAYVCTADTNGDDPPNVSFWDALPGVGAETIKGVKIELVDTNGTASPIYIYQWLGDSVTSGTLLLASQYLIQDYNSSDDFTNVGAGSNATGIIFTATGTTPTDWAANSVLQRVSLPSNMRITDGLIECELLAADTIDKSGLYEVRISLAVIDSIYVGTDAQTDVLCLADAVQITPC